MFRLTVSLLALVFMLWLVFTHYHKTLPEHELRNREYGCQQESGEWGRVKKNIISQDESAIDCLWYEKGNTRRNPDFRVGDKKPERFLQ